MPISENLKGKITIQMFERETMIISSFSIYFYQLTIGVIFILYIENIHPLKILHFSAPEFAALGARVSLSCLWRLEAGDRLYSVKWYKDGMEFFHYVPLDRAAYKKFLVHGVNVLSFTSYGSNITLGPAVAQTEGRYRCEVSGERPLFLTVTEYAYITILALPNNGPYLSGIGKHYKIGDTVTGNCTSGPSKHNVHLTWYINGVAADNDSSLSSELQDGLKFSTLSLKLKLTDKYSSTSCVKIKCLSTISSSYWRSNETCLRVTSARNTREREMQSSVELVSYSKGANLFMYYDLNMFCIIFSSINTFIKLR